MAVTTVTEYVPVSQPGAAALIVTGDVVRARPDTGKSAKVSPAATVMDAGTPTFVGSELESVTVNGEVTGALKATWKLR